MPPPNRNLEELVNAGVAHSRHLRRVPVRLVKRDVVDVTLRRRHTALIQVEALLRDQLVVAEAKYDLRTIAPAAEVEAGAVHRRRSRRVAHEQLLDVRRYPCAPDLGAEAPLRLVVVLVVSDRGAC